MPFGDWNHDGHVSPAEGWGTLLATGVVEDGDEESKDELGGGNAPGGNGGEAGGCMTALALIPLVGMALLAIIVVVLVAAAIVRMLLS